MAEHDEEVAVDNEEERHNREKSALTVGCVGGSVVAVIDVEDKDRHYLEKGGDDVAEGALGTSWRS